MRSLLLTAALTLAALAPAHAVTLPTDGSWAGFVVDANLPPYSAGWIDDDAVPLSFSVDIASGQIGMLTVVDTGFSGDRFHVYDNGTLLGSTGVATQGDLTGAITFDPDDALADAAFSRGSFSLGAGSHLITGVLFSSVTDATIGGLKLTVSPVPEPATTATLLIGLGLLLGLARRRNA